MGATTVWRRCTAALALTAAAAVSVAIVPPAGASGAGFTTASGGRVAVLPAGLRVYVRESGSSPEAVYWQARAVVAQLRDTGLPVRFAGWGSPADHTRGVVNIRTVPCSEPKAVGYVYPRNLATGWAEIRLSAVVAICPTAFRSGAVLRATMLGELGRAVGLGTYNDSYDGRKQMLNATVQPQYGQYQSGDRNGLRYLAAITRQVAPTLTPTAGGLAATPLPNGAIVLTGWALNGAENDNPAKVTIRRDGALLTVVRSTVATPAGAARAAAKHMSATSDFSFYDGHLGRGTHRFCARITDPGSITVTRVSLGCVSVTTAGLTATLDSNSGPDADGIITLGGTALLTGAPETPLTVSVLAGGVRRGDGEVDAASHTYTVQAAALNGTYEYCVVVEGGGQRVQAGCVRITSG